MPTFAGSYITEPRDFFIVTTEKALIETGDDPKAPTSYALSFVELLAESGGNPASNPYAEVVSVINENILDGEGHLDQAAKTAGYAIPLSSPGKTEKSIVIRWAWVGLQQRKRIITQAQADEARAALIKELTAISSGSLILDSAVEIEVTEIEEGMYDATHEGRMFSRARFEGAF